MRWLLALVPIALLSVCIVACGGASQTTGSTSRASSDGSAAAGSASATASHGAVQTTDYAQADSDKDNDSGPEDDKSNNGVLDYGHPASAVDARAVTALVKRYYAAAIAENGAKACEMLYSIFSEAIAEDYGQNSPGPAYLHAGKTCSQVMSLLFKHLHSQLRVELPKLKVARVRLNGHHGLALLSFGTMPERQISVAREGHAWKVESLIDSELP